MPSLELYPPISTTPLQFGEVIIDEPHNGKGKCGPIAKEKDSLNKINRLLILKNATN